MFDLIFRITLVIMREIAQMTKSRQSIKLLG